jgi:type IV pilus assembly protein PilC
MDYSYIGYSNEGQIIRGKIAAQTEHAAMERLHNTGYKVITIEPAVSFLPDVSNVFKGRVNQSELILFFRQLALLVEAGVGIVQSIELLRLQSANKEFKKVLFQIIADIRSGETLSSAMSSHKHIFSEMYVKLITVGEQTGNLEVVLRNMADYIERESVAMKKLKSSLMYPAIVICLAIVVGIIIIAVVLPPLMTFFQAFGGTELPLPTRMLLVLSTIMTDHGSTILLVFAALVLILFIYNKTASGKLVRDKLILKLPGIGQVTLLTELARACRSFSLLLKSGLNLPDVVSLAAQSSGNLVLKIALDQVGLEALRGQGLSGPMRSNPVFLPLMVEMTKVGEETGNLDDVLVTVAQNFEADAESRLQTLLTMIEPVMTVVIGAAVAFLALSVFLPLYSGIRVVG